ncbi:MAG: hypothetical protein RLZZ216_1523 [Cyanobacteriota bacterium]|jgi:RNA polymerase sigma-B factor
MKQQQCKRNRRVRQHLDLVLPLARYYVLRTNVDMDDLIQVGRLGLIRAANLYSESRGVPFSAYARPHIRGSILHYLRDSHGLVRLPRSIQDQASRGRSNGVDKPWESASSMGLSRLPHSTRWVSLDESNAEHAIDEKESAMHSLGRWERYGQLISELKRLPKDEQTCIQAVILQGRSLRQTARTLGVSAMTIHRRVKRGLERLSRRCSDLGMA